MCTVNNYCPRHLNWLRYRTPPPSLPPPSTPRSRIDVLEKVLPQRRHSRGAPGTRPCQDLEGRGRLPRCWGPACIPGGLAEHLPDLRVTDPVPPSTPPQWGAVPSPPSGSAPPPVLAGVDPGRAVGALGVGVGAGPTGWGQRRVWPRGGSAQTWAPPRTKVLRRIVTPPIKLIPREA